ncbi:MAG: hypothetical protein HZA83_00225 [Thaumarchaeota archaeon]|nr:hypothetical protein [Nitrososphaerota archaeon]
MGELEDKIAKLEEEVVVLKKEVTVLKRALRNTIARYEVNQIKQGRDVRSIVELE